MEKISRQEAIRSGQVRYFSGKPCPKGHITYRYTSTATCVVCLRNEKAKIREDIRRYREVAEASESTEPAKA